jgi:hypothetical protein
MISTRPHDIRVLLGRWAGSMEVGFGGLYWGYCKGDSCGLCFLYTIFVLFVDCEPTLDTLQRGDLLLASFSIPEL